MIAALLPGCASHRYVHTVEPLPVVVSPGGDDWGVELEVAFDDRIRLTLTNTSAEPVQVLWSECAYIDVDNRSHPLALSPGGAPSAGQASTIAPGTAVQEVLRPVGRGPHRGIDPLLPAGSRPLLLSPRFVGDPLFTPANAMRSLIGKEIGVFLVFSRQGRKKTVLTKYRIEQVDVT